MQKLSAGKFHFEPPFTLFDHLVGEREELGGDVEAERLGGHDIDDSDARIMNVFPIQII